MRAILAKSLRDQRRSAIGWTIALAGIALMYGLFYPSIRDSASDLAGYIENMPDAIKNIIGADFTSPSGYLRSELFSTMGPIVVIVWAIGAGARATAGEEEADTLDTLLSTPLARRTVLGAKAAAAVVVAAILAASLWTVLTVTGPPFELTVPSGDLAAACGLLALLGLAFGAIALAIGAWTGRRAMASAVAGTYAGLSYIVHALAPSVDVLERLDPLSAFRWYLEPSPLSGSISATSVAVLASIAIAGFAAARLGFERRDIGT